MAEDVDNAEIVGETNIDASQIFDALRECYDPEIPVNIVDLGLIYALVSKAPSRRHDVTDRHWLPCGWRGDGRGRATRTRCAEVEAVNVTLTFDPPWTPDRMTEDARWELGMS